MEKIIKKIKDYLRDNKKLLIFVFAFTFGFGLVAHGYSYFNANLNHDSLYGMIGNKEYNLFMLQIGRFIRPIWARIRGNITLPTLIGFISLFFVSCSNYLIIKLLKIKNKVLIAFTCGILITNYTVALTYASYIHDADIYSIALFLSVLSVYEFTSNNKLGLLKGTIILVISLGIYQAYFQVAIFLLMILAIERFINNEKALKVVTDYIKILLCMVVSIIIYYLIYQLTLKVFNVPIGDTYNSMPQLKDYFDLGAFAYIFEQMFKSERMWLMGKNAHHWWMIFGINVLCIVLTFFLFIKLIIKKMTSTINTILATIVLLLMPVGICIVCVMSKGLVHDIMTYSYFLFYVFVFKLIEMSADCYSVEIRLQSGIKYILYPCMVAMLISNNVYSNEVYLEKELMEQTTLSTMTRIINRMEETDGYEMGKTPVMMVGALNISDLSHTRIGFMNTGEGTNVAFTITYQGVYSKYFNDYLAYPINLVDDDTLFSNYYGSDDIKDMPVFPAKDSVKFYNDMLVVKISDYGD